MAITQAKVPFVFGMVVLATLLITAPAAHAACRSPKNICKHLDDCLQRTSDPNNKDTDGIRAGGKARNGQIVLAGAEACARDLGKNSNGTNGRVGVQNLNLSKLLRWDWNLEKSIATGTHNSERRLVAPGGEARG
jgi:hypothetical protein